jgi:hypothetical protein
MIAITFMTLTSVNILDESCKLRLGGSIGQRGPRIVVPILACPDFSTAKNGFLATREVQVPFWAGVTVFISV